MREKLEEILNREVRPYLSLEGGGIEVVSIEDDVVKVRFNGSCKMCPFASFTLKTLVESSIKNHFPHIKGVEII